MKNLLERTIVAAATFLERRGYDIVDSGWKSGDSSIDIVARDEDGTLVVVDVRARRGADEGFPVATASRGRSEMAAARWLESHPDEGGCECPVRFDSISMMIVAPDRALLRPLKDRFAWVDEVA